MRRLKTVRRPPIYPKTPGHLPYSLTHPLPLSSRRPSVSFGGFGITYKPWVPGNQVYLAAAAVQLSGPGMFGAIGEASPAQFLAFLFGAKAEHMIDQLLSESSELEGHMGDWGVAVKLLDRIGLPHADKSEPEKVLLHNQARFWSSSISNSERNKFGAQFQAYVTNEERRLIRQMQEDERVKREEKSNESK